MYNGNQLDRFNQLYLHSFVFCKRFLHPDLCRLMNPVKYLLYYSYTCSSYIYVCVINSDQCGSTHPVKQLTCQKLDSTQSMLSARRSFRRKEWCSKKEIKILFTIIWSGFHQDISFRAEVFVFDHFARASTLFHPPNIGSAATSNFTEENLKLCPSSFNGSPLRTCRGKVKCSIISQLM